MSKFTVPSKHGDIVARLMLPKQRATRPYGIVMIAQSNGTYSTHTEYYDEIGGMESGHYDMTFSQAWDDFRARGRLEFSRNVGVFESDYSKKEG